MRAEDVVKFIRIGKIIHGASSVVFTAECDAICLGLTYIAHRVLLSFFLGCDHGNVKIAILKLSGDAKKSLRTRGIANISTAGERKRDVSGFEKLNNFVFITGVFYIYVVGIKKLFIELGIVFEVHLNLLADGAAEMQIGLLLHLNIERALIACLIDGNFFALGGTYLQIHLLRAVEIETSGTAAQDLLHRAWKRGRR